VAFCSKCGTQVNEGSAFCQNCGATVAGAESQVQAATAPPPAPTAQPAATGKTSGLATASLVMGIIGIFFNILSILALVFGFISLNHIKKNPALKGKGLAMGGIILGFIGLLIWIVAVALLGNAISFLFRQ